MYLNQILLSMALSTVLTVWVRSVCDIFPTVYVVVISGNCLTYELIMSLLRINVALSNLKLVRFVSNVSELWSITLDSCENGL